MHDIDFFSSEFKKVIKNGLPGVKAQLSMAPSFRFPKRLGFLRIFAKRSAVLILVFPKNNSLKFILIKRSDDGRKHSGQISLPGGKSEKSDFDIIETAIRETFEEIGVKKDKVEVIDVLTPLFIPVSNFLVYPVVGVTHQEPEFFKNPDEVQEVIEADLFEIMKKSSIQVKTINIKKIQIQAPYYAVNGHSVWGATAMILSEFLHITQQVFAKIVITD